METEKLLTLKEAAAVLRVSESTLRAWIKSGKAKPLRPGRAYLFPPEEIERILHAKPDSSEPEEPQA